jgi:hypothetical protein
MCTPPYPTPCRRSRAARGPSTSDHRSSSRHCQARVWVQPRCAAVPPTRGVQTAVTRGCNRHLSRAMGSARPGPPLESIRSWPYGLAFEMDSRRSTALGSATATENAEGLRAERGPGLTVDGEPACRRETAMLRCPPSVPPAGRLRCPAPGVVRGAFGPARANTHPTKSCNESVLVEETAENLLST